MLPYRLYSGFLDLDKQSPRPTKALARTELPDDTSNGPHFFYGLQWWFFGALAVFGFFYLLWDEFRRRRDEPDQPLEASERAQHPAVHGQHRPADER